MVEFAGYEMALWYSGISVEHLTVRNSCGVFDISHMGRVIVGGDNSATFLDRLVPSNILNLPIGKGLYTVLCNESAGIIDDIIIYRVADAKFLVVVNAANLGKNLLWMNAKNNFDAKISDITMKSAMLAVQGPDSAGIMQKIGLDVSSMARFGISEFNLQSVKCMVSRTSYTGEDGFELVITDSDNNEKTLTIWSEIISAGAVPCGLGARDTLRLEAGLCLYGQDLNENTTPVEANLAWIIAKKGDYVGKPVIEAQMKDRSRILRVGIEMSSQGIPRKGHSIYRGSKIGEVTSGTFSPLLKKGIAMGYVLIEHTKEGAEVEVDIRGQKFPAKIVKPPFYDQAIYGWKRIRKN